MKFNSLALSFTLLASTALHAAAFAPSVAFTRSASQAVSLSQPVISAHDKSCVCSGCSGSALRMAEDGDAAPAAEVPAEVAAIDGTATDEEVHNKDRPARGSGIKKHKGGREGKPLSELEVGSTVEGTVKTITTYGAFVDIGCQSDALLHVSRMSDDFTSDPNDVVSNGDKVEVRIVSVDKEKNQIAVTMQSPEAEAKASEGRGSGGRRKERPQRSGGDRAAQRAAMNALTEKGFDDGKMIEGEVVNTLDFGAFVRVDVSQLGEGLEGEIDGLVHISVLSEGRAESVSSIVSVGDKVQVRVKTVDVDGGKVGLSMITKEAEAANPQRGGRRPKGGNRNAMFRPDEMGAADWKESMEKKTEEMPTFKNMPIIESKRKQAA